MSPDPSEPARTSRRGPLGVGSEVRHVAGRHLAGQGTARGTHMEIHGAGGAQGPQPIYPRLAAFTIESGQTVQAQAPRDQVEISPLAQMLDGINQLPEIRHERVEAIRSQIASGVYETPEKLELALDRMMDEMGW